MKKLLNISATVLMLLVIDIPITQAHEGHFETSPIETSDPNTLNQRVDQRKKVLPPNLSDADKKRLTIRCKAVQGLIQSQQAKADNLETKRTQVYHDVIDRLRMLAERLKGKGLNVNELQTQIADLEDKITVFKNEVTNFKQIIADMSVMDCQADPEGFKASLEAARASRKSAAEKAQDIKSYVNQTIKATLLFLREQLAMEGS